MAAPAENAGGGQVDAAIGGGQTVAASSAASSASGSSSASGADPAALPALDNRQIVRTADLQVLLTIGRDVADADYDAAQRESIEAAVNKARSQVISSGGFVADLQQSTGSASLVLRIPADRYDSFRDSAAQWGEVISSTENAQDVTDEYTDVTSRIASAKTSIDRMRTLLAQATSVADIIAVESELSRREADLESLQGRQVVLSNQVSLGTVSVTFTATRDAAVAVTTPTPDRSGFLGGLANGWDGLTSFLGGVAVLIGTLLPFVPLLAVLVALGWLVRRRLRTQAATGTRAPAPADPTAV